MEITPLGIVLADAPPKGEAKVAAAGAAVSASRMDHEHPRLTSATKGVLNGSGEATVIFTRTFSEKPCVIPNYVEAADNQPVAFKVKSWLGTTGDPYVSGDYGGCIIKGYRSQTIPTNLVSLLIGGVFNLFNGSAAGVEYSAIALQPSTV